MQTALEIRDGIIEVERRLTAHRDRPLFMDTLLTHLYSLTH